ncbi:class I SAM-dependent methyltransferase [Ekhidna sp.]|uniref:class I SAM-dependent methyltransferase n=1 Tax=Ekhidna sp. TaxID=2608089 RepID=UPI003299A81B
MLLERLKNDGRPELKLNSLQKKTKKLVSQKVNTGTYKFENINCPVCENNRATIIGEKDRYGLSYITNICSSCGLVYTNPRMNEASYAEFYNQEYRKLYVGKESPTIDFFESQRRKGKRIFSFLLSNKLISKNKLHVLEVGCGAGGILHFFRSKGHAVEGLDLGAEYVKYGVEDHGLPLTVGSLESLSLSYKPDLIIYSHVMEHILDLNKELQLLKKISHQNTVIYIEVPGIKYVHKNFRSNILRYFQNAHTFHFSLESLKNILTKNGFELVVGNQTIESAFKINDHNYSIKNDYNEVKDYLFYVEKNRPYYKFTAQGMKENLRSALDWGLRFTKLKWITRKISS